MAGSREYVDYETLRCFACNVSGSSPSDFQSHVVGNRHYWNVDRLQQGLPREVLEHKRRRTIGSAYHAPPYSTRSPLSSRASAPTPASCYRGHFDVSREEGRRVVSPGYPAASGRGREEPPPGGGFENAPQSDSPALAVRGEPRRGAGFSTAQSWDVGGSGRDATQRNEVAASDYEHPRARALPKISTAQYYRCVICNLHCTCKTS